MVTTTLAKHIDHTLLKAEANADAIRKLCHEAKEFGFWSVCVNPCWISLCKEELRGSFVKICTVVGFPLGANRRDSKAAEAVQSFRAGADELDMVINIGLVKSGLWDDVREDIAGVVRSAGAHVVKVILETGALTDDEKTRACQISREAGAKFVKTSTGFGPGGATIEDIALMKRAMDGKLKIKASGGIRDLETMQKMLEAGADRIGTSSAAHFLRGLTAEGSY